MKRYAQLIGLKAEYDGADPETQRWWDWMVPMQQPLEERAEGAWWHDIDEVFHTD